MLTDPHRELMHESIQMRKRKLNGGGTGGANGAGGASDAASSGGQTYAHDLLSAFSDVPPTVISSLERLPFDVCMAPGTKVVVVGQLDGARTAKRTATSFSYSQANAPLITEFRSFMRAAVGRATNTTVKAAAGATADAAAVQRDSQAGLHMCARTLSGWNLRQREWPSFLHML